MRIKDSKGNPSTTLTFVTSAFAVVLVKFVFAGMWLVPPMTAGEFGSAVMVIVAPWVAREFKEKWKG